MSVDWSNPKARISKYFTVHEATFLPSWGIYHFPSETERANILKTAQAMDLVREFLGTPITVECWIRPKSVYCPGHPQHGEDYNKAKGGAKSSGHINGLAVDWRTKLNCDQVRTKLKPKLAEFAICCEDLPGATWVHTDILPPRKNTGRFFKPF